MKLDSTPRKRGETYCSPRCGCGCKLAAYEQAQAEANALAKKMGDGWEIRIWENFGWHYSVSKGAATIRPELKVPFEPGKSPSTGGWEVTGYSCWLSPAIHPQVIEKSDDPAQALKMATKVAKIHVRSSIDALETLT